MKNNSLPLRILTFDIEEWFHLLNFEPTTDINKWDSFEVRIHRNLEIILEILENNQQKASFFVLGWIAKKHPEIVKKIDRLGYEIGIHSYAHQQIYKHNQKKFIQDLKLSLETLRSIIGQPINIYRAPGFSINNNTHWVFEELFNHGINIDCSIVPTHHHTHGGYPQFPTDQPCIIKNKNYSIFEFPINTVSLFGNSFIFSGGGYFRALPYPLIHFLTKQKAYIMAYFHPRDFDNNQLKWKSLGMKRYLTSYIGLKSCRNKLDRWIKDFKFVDIKTVSTLIDWKKVKEIHL